MRGAATRGTATRRPGRRNRRRAAVSIVLPIEADRDARPFGRRVAAGLIGQHITMVVGVNTGNDEAGLVGFVARTYRRIDRNNDSDQFRDTAMCRPSGIFDARSIPQSARHIIEDLGVELLATEPGSFVFPNDLFEKRRDSFFTLSKRKGTPASERIWRRSRAGTDALCSAKPPS